MLRFRPASVGPDLIGSDGQDLRPLQAVNDDDNIAGGWATTHDEEAVIDSQLYKVRVVDSTGALVAAIEIGDDQDGHIVYSPVSGIYVTSDGGLSFDPTDQVLYYSGEPGDGTPYSIYRVRLDGTGRARLTYGLDIEDAPVVLP